MKNYTITHRDLVDLITAVFTNGFHDGIMEDLAATLGNRGIHEYERAELEAIANDYITSGLRFKTLECNDEEEDANN